VEQHAALTAKEPELRAAALEAVRERLAAKAQAKAVADQAKRAAGEKDATVLTVDLLKEELRLRRARGEIIERMPKNKAETLEMIAAARSVAPDIPTAAATAPGGTALLMTPHLWVARQW
jgi:hypothetical protein